MEFTISPVVASQAKTSVPATVSASLPSGLNSPHLGKTVCDSRTWRGSPFSASQSIAVLSPEMVRIDLPSRLNLADETQSLCRASVASLLPVAVSQMMAVRSSEAVAMRRPSGLNVEDQAA